MTLDIMPTDSQILGFGNLWYSSAVEHAEIISISSGKKVRMVSSPYFLITKLEAFAGRGNGDYQLSHDIEDIVAVIDGRPEIAGEVEQVEEDLRQALSDRFRELLQESRFIDAVSGHMPTDETSQARVVRVINIIKKIAR